MMLIGISWLEKRIQNRCGRAPDLDGSKSGQGMLYCKMIAAACSLHCYMAVAGGLAYSVAVYFNGDEWEFGACYYFAFASFSTIGFGDFAFGPTDDSLAQFIYLLLQAPIIFLGLASFNTFAAIGTEWLSEAVPSLPVVLGIGGALGILLTLVVALPSSAGLSMGVGITCAASLPRVCCMIGSPPRVKPSGSSLHSSPSVSRSETPGPSEVADNRVRTMCNDSPLQTPEHEPPSLNQEQTRRDSEDEALECEEKQSPRQRLQRGCKLALGVLYRLTKQTVAGYAIMLIGGLLLYEAEAQVEMDAACSARAEENLKRAAMRLLPMVDQVCT